MAEAIKPCPRGHRDRQPSGNCRPCSNERVRAWKAAHRKPRVRAEFRKCGHGWDDSYKGGRDCGSCAREQERNRRDARRGGPPRKADPHRFPCGHPRSEARLTKPDNCGTCHREKQKARYRTDPATHRAKALAHQKANRAAANARLRAFRERNPGYEATRKYAPDAETRAWLDIIRADPCSYCGSPSNAVDHIKAVSRGGDNHWSNFAPTCRSCNSSKRDRELLPWLLAFRSGEAA